MKNFKRPWLKFASLKGVEVRKKMRAKQESEIKAYVKKRLESRDTYRLLSRLCGFIMGDGYLSIRREKGKKWFHHEISFYPDNIEVAELFRDTFKDIYKKEPSIKTLNNYFRVRVVSPVACKHLSSFSKFSTLDWRIPDFVLKDNESKIEFLRAIFDCEGYVGKRNIQFQSVNREGIYQIKYLLMELGIISSIYSYKRTNPRWNINYILVISRRENIKKYAQTIGFNHPLKIIKLVDIAGVPERLMGQSRELVSARTSRFDS